VYELHDAQLPDDTLYRAAVGTGSSLPTLLIDLLENPRAPQIVDTGPTQFLQELTTFRFPEKDFCAVLANILQCRLDVFQVADVEDREGQLDVAKMTGTLMDTEMACATLALSVRARRSLRSCQFLYQPPSGTQNTNQARIEGSMWEGRSSILNIVE
jgi:hypothetical protein